jgi:hypothetical protein
MDNHGSNKMYVRDLKVYQNSSLCSGAPLCTTRYPIVANISATTGAGTYIEGMLQNNFFTGIGSGLVNVTGDSSGNLSVWSLLENHGLNFNGSEFVGTEVVGSNRWVSLRNDSFGNMKLYGGLSPSGNIIPAGTTYSIGSPALPWRIGYFSQLNISSGVSDVGAASTAQSITAGSGTPASNACTASTLGSLYLNTAGGTTTSLYVCTAVGTWTGK